MSEAKHTDGPWRVYKNVYVSAPRVKHISPTVADCSNRLIDKDAREANARLIAAAPELLAALEWVERDVVNDTPEMWRAVSEAIAKAKGK